MTTQSLNQPIPARNEAGRVLIPGNDEGLHLVPGKLYVLKPGLWKYVSAGATMYSDAPWIYSDSQFRCPDIQPTIICTLQPNIPWMFVQKFSESYCNRGTLIYIKLIVGDKVGWIVGLETNMLNSIEEFRA